MTPTVAMSADLDFTRFLKTRHVPKLLRERLVIPAAVMSSRDYDAETARLLNVIRIERAAASTPLPHDLNPTVSPSLLVVGRTQK